MFGDRRECGEGRAATKVEPDRSEFLVLLEGLLGSIGIGSEALRDEVPQQDDSTHVLVLGGHFGTEVVHQDHVDDV